MLRAKAAPQLRAVHLRLAAAAAGAPARAAPAMPARAPLSVPAAARLLSSSAPRAADDKSSGPGQGQGEPRGGSGGKSPFQVFFDTFRSELKKSKELQEEIKALQDETGRLSESSAFKRAKEALDRSREATSATGRGIKRAGEAVGTAASATWNSTPVRGARTAASKTADAVDKASAPIRNTELYRNIKDVIDDGASIRYGGFEEKGLRRQRRVREQELQRQLDRALGRHGPVKENENAGENVVVHDTAKPEKDFSESPLGKRLRDLRIAIDESENGLVAGLRDVADKIGGLFAETEAARVTKTFRQMDPSFSQDAFLRELRNYILPEVLDAYVRGDRTTLQTWFSEASFNVWDQTTKEYRDKGLYSAGRVLDIRGSDIVQAKLLTPADLPVYVISCRAQETNVYKSLKTDEVVAGVPDQILLSTYVMVMTRVPEELENEETHGWKILEFVRGRSQDWM